MTSLKKQAYRHSRTLADIAWYYIQFWGTFSKSTVGQPFIKSLDQLSLHLGKTLSLEKAKAEEKTEMAIAYEKFQEAALWCDIARRRKLLNRLAYQELYKLLTELKHFFEPTNTATS